MDVKCCNCREPWDQYYLRHELKELTSAELKAEGWQFGRNRLVVLHCPCCKQNGSKPDEGDVRRLTLESLADLLGDDEDGLASTLEDFDL